MAETKAKTIGRHVAAVLLAIVFLGAGSTKLAGLEMHVEHFRGWGYPLWFVYVTGALELTGALLVLIPRSRVYGATILACVMVGAIGTHLRAGETDRLWLPVVLLFLSGGLALSLRPHG